jgi:hypothetical protein
MLPPPGWEAAEFRARVATPDAEGGTRGVLTTNTYVIVTFNPWRYQDVTAPGADCRSRFETRLCGWHVEREARSTLVIDLDD